MPPFSPPTTNRDLSSGDIHRQVAAGRWGRGRGGAEMGSGGGGGEGQRWEVREGRDGRWGRGGDGRWGRGRGPHVMYLSNIDYLQLLSICLSCCPPLGEGTGEGQQSLTQCETLVEYAGFSLACSVAIATPSHPSLRRATAGEGGMGREGGRGKGEGVGGGGGGRERRGRRE